VRILTNPEKNHSLTKKLKTLIGNDLR